MRISFFSAALAGLLLVGCAGPKAPEPVFQAYSENETTSPAPKTVILEKPANPSTEVKPEVAPAVVPAPTQPIVSGSSSGSSITVVQGLKGRIASVNTDLKFVVITFPVGQMARADQRLTVYREGLKVGELTATGAPLDDSIVADISAGEAKVGDEVRDK